MHTFILLNRINYFQNILTHLTFRLNGWFSHCMFVLYNTTALDTEVSSWGGVIVTPGQKAYEKQQDQEDEEGEGEGDDDDEESSEMSGQELAEEKMETNQES